MAKKTTENPDQLSLDFDDWLAAPAVPQAPPVEAGPSPRFALARRLSEILEGGESLSARRLSTEATDVFGGTQAEGAWLSKDAYDAMEVAVNLHLLRTEGPDWTALDAEGAAAKARDLTRLVQRLPTQTRRDEEMDEFQQFSTPPALAFVANWVARVEPRDIVAEPSAQDVHMMGRQRGQTGNIFRTDLVPIRSQLLQRFLDVEGIPQDDSVSDQPSAAKERLAVQAGACLTDKNTS